MRQRDVEPVGLDQDPFDDSPSGVRCRTISGTGQVVSSSGQRGREPPLREPHDVAIAGRTSIAGYPGWKIQASMIRRTGCPVSLLERVPQMVGFGVAVARACAR